VKKITVFFSLLLFATNVVASDASKKLTQKGYQQLTKSQFEAALKDFQTASKADPSDGEALFFQGVALNRLGRFSDAGQKLNAAQKLGSHPDWNFEMGLAQYGMGDYQKSEGYFKKARKDNPARKKEADFYLSKMTDKGDQKTEQPKKWGLYANAAGSYNTNALNLGNGVTRPTNISRQESGLANLVLGGNYRFDLSDSTKLSVGNQAYSDIYEVTSRLNLFDNYTFLQFRHTFDKTKALGISVSNDFTVVQTAKFRNQVNISPVFSWEFADWYIAELGYAFAYGKYFFPSNPAQRRTGFSNSILFNNYFSVPDTKLRFRLGYSHIWNEAKGGDFDYHGNSLIFAVSNPVFWKVTGELFFSQAWNRYSNVNSLTTGTKRSDNISNALLQFNIPVVKHLNGFLRAGYTRNGSNIAVYNYRAWQGTLGFLGSF